MSCILLGSSSCVARRSLRGSSFVIWFVYRKPSHPRPYGLYYTYATFLYSVYFSPAQSPFLCPMCILMLILLFNAYSTFLYLNHLLMLNPTSHSQSTLSCWIHVLMLSLFSYAYFSFSCLFHFRMLTPLSQNYLHWAFQTSTVQSIHPCHPRQAASQLLLKET